MPFDRCPLGLSIARLHRGTLAGDLLWLGTIGFILAIITGDDRLSEPALFSLQARSLAQ